MTDQRHFSHLIRELTTRATRAYVSTLGPRSHGLAQYLSKKLTMDDASADAVMADPLFEATFGWEQAPQTIADLAGKLIHPRLVRAMDEAPRDTRFGKDWHPFVHQLAAWKTLSSPTSPRSLIVSSGTGSGKTECFTVPVLNDLARQADEEGELSGVRALFLYPLNALIASQRQRLSDWLAPFGKRVRYCLYNGDTRESPRRGMNTPPHEVNSRRQIRNDPPPIMVTNGTMLEYMLVRNNDAPILEASRGKLRWIVLDEAHSYVGSQAAEVALLLRRVMDGFQTEPDKVRFIATSATIATGSDRAGVLRRYLAGLAGISEEQVVVCEGARKIPPLPEAGEVAVSTDDLEEIAGFDARERYAFLADSPAARAVRTALVGPDGPAASLGALARAIDAGAPEGVEPTSRARVLELLDVAHQAESPEGQPFLPLRAHLFQRTLAGLWACANPECPGCDPALRASADWSFGKVHLARRATCECGAAVFPLCLCSTCGAEYLSFSEHIDIEGNRRLEGRDPLRDDDETELDELQEAEDEDGAAEQVLPDRPTARFMGPHTLAGRGRAGSTIHKRVLDPFEPRLRPSGEGSIVYIVHPDAGGRFSCARCGEKERTQGSLLRSCRVGAPFTLGVSIPTLIEHAPPLADPFVKDEKGERVRLPADGRRAITFTDSRQGTARFALKAGLQAERMFVRRAIVESLAELKLAAPAIPANLQELKNERAEFAEQLETEKRERFRRMFKEEIERLDAKINPPVPALRLSWSDLRRRLTDRVEVRHWLLKTWSERIGVESETALAQFFLFRELLRRPRRANSLETLGFVSLRYAKIDGLTRVPSEVASCGLEDSGDWRDFLHVLIDVFVRGASCVEVQRDFGPASRMEFDYYRWMGSVVRGQAVVEPGGNASGAQYRNWPSPSQSIRSYPVRLLARVLGLSLDDELHRTRIDQILRSAFDTLRSYGMLVPHPRHDGFVTRLDEVADIELLSKAWWCPVTRRLMHTTLRGITPYQEDPLRQEDVTCRRVELPELYRLDDAETWIETDERVATLRSLGAWTETSDRIVTRQPFFRVAEHSAHISGDALRRREEQFKSGETNLLSCSTTMEMGVDIGGISSVAMNNVPPAPANYLQRVGRAGRRKEKAAIGYTLCQPSPHGEEVFRNPRWPFVTRIQPPAVSLEQARLVQRHVHALGLRHFLSQFQPQDVLKLTSGWFFSSVREIGQTAPVDQFVFWLEELTQRAGEDEVALLVSLRHLLRGTALEGVEPATLFDSVADAILEIAEVWQAEERALLDQLEPYGGPLNQFRKDAPSPQKVLSIQLIRLQGEYLLRDLASRVFLPGHGFPTHVVPFMPITAENKAIARLLNPEGTGDARNRDFPTRQLPMAIREYAPGNSVTIDGKVYQSAGVTLNWKTPASATGARNEIQAIRYAWQCQSCGTSGTTTQRVTVCGNPRCGEEGLRPLEYLQPAGFSVEYSYRAHNDVDRAQYIAPLPPRISAAHAELEPLQAPHYGFIRYTEYGSIFHYSEGEHRHGYALCLKCGYACSELEMRRGKTVGEIAKAYTKHRRLSGDRGEDEVFCPGADLNNNLSKRHIALGIEVTTDVTELQLLDPRTGVALTKEQATTLAVALRSAVCGELGIEDRELGWAVQRTQFPRGEPGHAILLYDTASGGAGFVSHVQRLLPMVFAGVVELLDCPRDCDSACHACLLTYDTQYAMAALDRSALMNVVDAAFVEGFQLPDELRVFGPDTRAEGMPLHRAIDRELRGQVVDGLRLYLHGEGVSWDLPQWPTLARAADWSRRVAVQLVLSESSYSGLDGAARSKFASTLEFCEGLELIMVPDAQFPRGTACELMSGRGVKKWGADPERLVPGPDYDSAGTMSRVVARVSEVATPVPGHRPSPDELRPSDRIGALERIEIRAQLNGDLEKFPRVFLEKILLPKSPSLADAIRAGRSIARIQYSDRYLHNPSSLRILHAFLKDALRVLQPALCESTRVTVRTMAKGSWDRARTPTGLAEAKSDWGPEDMHVRDTIAKLMLGPLAQAHGLAPLEFDGSADRANVSHARGLALHFEDGGSWNLQLDEGLGFLRPAGRRVMRVDFGLAPVELAEEIIAAPCSVRKTGNFPTLVFVTV